MRVMVLSTVRSSIFILRMLSAALAVRDNSARFCPAGELRPYLYRREGQQSPPVMIHRVIYGAIERFLGVYIENVAGAFPAWLAPVQAIVLPISDKHLNYAKKVSDELEEKGVRVQIDERTESIGKKIREAEMQKIPFMLIVGDKEIEANKVAVRKYGEGDKGQSEVSGVIKEVSESK